MSLFISVLFMGCLATSFGASCPAVPIPPLKDLEHEIIGSLKADNSVTYSLDLTYIPNISFSNLYLIIVETEFDNNILKNDVELNGGFICGQEGFRTWSDDDHRGSLLYFTENESYKYYIALKSKKDTNFTMNVKIRSLDNGVQLTDKEISGYFYPFIPFYFYFDATGPFSIKHSNANILLKKESRPNGTDYDFLSKSDYFPNFATISVSPCISSIDIPGRWWGVIAVGQSIYFTIKLNQEHYEYTGRTILPTNGEVEGNFGRGNEEYDFYELNITSNTIIDLTSPDVSNMEMYIYKLGCPTDNSYKYAIAPVVSHFIMIEGGNWFLSVKQKQEIGSYNLHIRTIDDNRMNLSNNNPIKLSLPYTSWFYFRVESESGVLELSITGISRVTVLEGTKIIRYFEIEHNDREFRTYIACERTNISTSWDIQLNGFKKSELESSVVSIATYESEGIHSIKLTTGSPYLSHGDNINDFYVMNLIKNYAVIITISQYDQPYSSLEIGISDSLCDLSNLKFNINTHSIGFYRFIHVPYMNLTSMAEIKNVNRSIYSIQFSHVNYRDSPLDLAAFSDTTIYLPLFGLFYFNYVTNRPFSLYFYNFQPDVYLSKSILPSLYESDHVWARSSRSTTINVDNCLYPNMEINGTYYIGMHYESIKIAVTYKLIEHTDPVNLMNHVVSSGFIPEHAYYPLYSYKSHQMMVRFIVKQKQQQQQQQRQQHQHESIDHVYLKKSLCSDKKIELHKYGKDTDTYYTIDISSLSDHTYYLYVQGSYGTPISVEVIEEALLDLTDEVTGKASNASAPLYYRLHIPQNTGFKLDFKADRVKFLLQRNQLPSSDFYQHAHKGSGSMWECNVGDDIWYLSVNGSGIFTATLEILKNDITCENALISPKKSLEPGVIAITVLFALFGFIGAILLIFLFKSKFSRDYSRFIELDTIVPPGTSVSLKKSFEPSLLPDQSRSSSIIQIVDNDIDCEYSQPNRIIDYEVPNQSTTKLGLPTVTLSSRIQ